MFTYGLGSREAREAGARFVVTREPLPGAAPVFQDNGAYVYEDKEALPRVRDTEGKMVETITSSPTRVVVMREGFLPGQIIVADQWYPGWHVYYHGKAVAMTKGPDIFRTIAPTPEQQRLTSMNNPLEMRYEPEAFRVGLYGLCLALGGAATVTAAAFTRRLDRRRRA